MLLHIEISSSEILPPRSFYRNTFFSQEKKKKKRTTVLAKTPTNFRFCEILVSTKFQCSKLWNPRFSKFSNSQATPTIDFSNLLTFKLPNFSNVLFSNCETFKFVHTQISKFPSSRKVLIALTLHFPI